MFYSALKRCINISRWCFCFFKNADYCHLLVWRVIGLILRTLCTRLKYTLDGMPMHHRALDKHIHTYRLFKSANPLTGMFLRWEETKEYEENHTATERTCESMQRQESKLRTEPGILQLWGGILQSMLHRATLWGCTEISHSLIIKIKDGFDCLGSPMWEGRP